MHNCFEERLHELSVVHAIVLDTRETIAMFDGRRAHDVTDFEGDRLSMVVVVVVCVFIQGRGCSAVTRAFMVQTMVALFFFFSALACAPASSFFENLVVTPILVCSLSSHFWLTVRTEARPCFQLKVSPHIQP